MKNILVYIVLSLASLSVRAGEGNDIDSLKHLLQSNTDLKSRMEIYTLLSREYQQEDVQKAREYARQALQLSRSSGIEDFLGDVYRNLGDIALKQDSLDLAIHYFEKAYGALEKDSNMEKLVKIIILLGITDFLKDHYAEAMMHYMRAIKLSQEYNIDDDLGILFLNTGNINVDFQNYEEAILNFSRAIEIFKKRNDSLNMPKAYHNLGIVYRLLGDTSQSRLYLEQATELYQKIGNTRGMASSYLNLAKLKRLSGDYPEAIHLLNSALDFLEEESLQYSAPYSVIYARIYQELGENFWLKGDVQAAYDNFNHSFRLAKMNQQIAHIASASRGLSKIWEQRKNVDSAFHYFKIYQSYSDSLSNEENIKKLAYLESQFKYEQQINDQKEARIKEVTHEKKRYQLMLFISLGLLLIILIMILLVFFLRQKARKSDLKQKALKEELEKRNKELTSHVMSQMKKNEFILDISKKLQQEVHNFKDQERKLIENIIQDLERDSNDNAWEEFEVRFHRVHTDFNKKLLERFPDLTSNDLRLCAFIRLNMNTKEISAITYQSTSSIDTARFRLRQKLGLQKDDNLIAFLSKF